MSVSAEEALKREASHRIIPKVGSIMNKDVLSAISEAVDEAIDNYGSRFGNVIKHNTTGQKVRESMVSLGEKILSSFEDFLKPEILVVPRQVIKALPLKDGGLFGENAVNDVIKCVKEHGQFVSREVAENQDSLVQIIPCGLLTYQDEIFLFQRKESDPKYRLYGKTTIWQGCHVSQQESIEMADLLAGTLSERISKSLFLSRVFHSSPLGYCWDDSNPDSSRHFGVVYRITIDNPHTAADLKKKEFRRQRGHGLSGQFLELQQIEERSDELKLETWSQTILGDLKKRT